jgi:hypothetical protein
VRHKTAIPTLMQARSDQRCVVQGSTKHDVSCMMHEAMSPMGGLETTPTAAFAGQEDALWPTYSTSPVRQTGALMQFDQLSRCALSVWLQVPVQQLYLCGFRFLCSSRGNSSSSTLAAQPPIILPGPLTSSSIPHPCTRSSEPQPELNSNSQTQPICAICYTKQPAQELGYVLLASLSHCFSRCTLQVHYNLRQTSHW